jgi:hypothetical protein
VRRFFFVAATVSVLFFVWMPSAHAYAIYNHMDKPLCVQPRLYHDINRCKFWVDPHSHHNGAHGSGLDNVWFKWLPEDGEECHITTVPADIPDGGWADAFTDTVKVYRHDGYYLGGYPFEKVRMCAEKPARPKE